MSATATAEAFNPSNSGNEGNQVTGTITPVQPRCVKPWVIPNLDPLNPSGCSTGANLCKGFVDPGDGHILNPGISVNGVNTGVIGERFTLVPDCDSNKKTQCTLIRPPQANGPAKGASQPDLDYLPGQTLNASVAVAGTPGNVYEQAVAGCDQTTIYYCGVPYTSPIGSGPNNVDLQEYPVDDTSDGVTALINQASTNPVGGQPDGQDYFNSSATPYGIPSSYPFQIFPGSHNLLGLGNTSIISVSNSIVTVPIYDPNNPIANNGTTSPVTIMGFLQVFINAVDQHGNLDVVVLNVAGCSNGSSQTVGSAVTGSSPVPVRLIKPP